VRYYDVHLHLPSADRRGLDQFLRRGEAETALVGGNLILNTRPEVELICRYRAELPPHFTVVPYYHAVADLGNEVPYSGWLKIHPRLSQLDSAKVPGVLEHLLALQPTPRGLIVDCFPWGPDLEYDVSLSLVIRIATAMPNTSILVAHGGGYQSWAFRAHTVSLKNTLYDFSATLSYYVGSDVLRPLQNYLRFIPERVLFGSDWPFVEPAQQLAECERLALEIGISPGQLETILLANAERLWPRESYGASL
jgi:predicted TIM-barrel fold metal-dependent hydrolase